MPILKSCARCAAPFAPTPGHRYCDRCAPTGNATRLTKAQALWFEMMDKKEFDHAFEFLLNLHRSALPEQASP